MSCRKVRDTILFTMLRVTMAPLGLLATTETGSLRPAPTFMSPRSCHTLGISFLTLKHNAEVMRSKANTLKGYLPLVHVRRD
eukprot:scaffold42224_cov37-Cyclotella_meneghiniana.AAC.5